MFERVREELDIYLERDPIARSYPEIIFCYPGLHAVLFHRMSHWLWSNHMKWLGRFLSHIARFLTGIEIHPGVKMGRRVFIDHGMGVVIGGTAEIHDDVSIYQGVTLGGTTQTYKGKRHPTLEKGVIVGAGAKILGPFTVGENSKIGSNAVVVKEVPPNSTVVGIPGKIVGKPDETSKSFRAYAHDEESIEKMSREIPEPVREAHQELAQRIERVEREMERLAARVGADPEDGARPGPPPSDSPGTGANDAATPG